jgi:hypothetical protein
MQSTHYIGGLQVLDYEIACLRLVLIVPFFMSEHNATDMIQQTYWQTDNLMR